MHIYLRLLYICIVNEWYYFNFRFIGETVYVMHTLDLQEDVCAACFAQRVDYVLVGTPTGKIEVN